jgi:hypothetical protein
MLNQEKPAAVLDHTAMREPKRDDPNLAEVKEILGRLQRISRKPRAGNAPAGEDESPSLQEDGPESAEGDSISRPAGMAALMNAPLLVKAVVVAVPVLAIAGAVMLAGGNRVPASVKEPPPGAAPHSEAGRSTSAPAVGSKAADEANPPINEVRQVEEAKPIKEARPVEEAKPIKEAKAVEGVRKPVPEERKISPVLEDALQLMAAGKVQAARTELFSAMKDDTADVAWHLARSYDPNVLVTVPAADAGPDVAEATRWYRTWYDIAVRQGQVSDGVSLERIIRSMD